MKGLWTITLLELREARRRRVVLVLGLMALGMVLLTAGVMISINKEVGLTVAQTSLGAVQTFAGLLGLILGAGALGNGNAAAGLAVQPVDRRAIVLGRYFANVLIVTGLIFAAALVGIGATLLAGGPESTVVDTLRGAGIISLNTALAVALAMFLAEWIPSLAAAIVAWVTLNVAKGVFGFIVFGSLVGVPEIWVQIATLASVILPHQVMDIASAGPPLGVEITVSLPMELVWTTAWVLLLAVLSALRFQRKDL